MTPGLVSIIVPVFNRPALLAEAVGSALAQTYRPIEILIVDDGSTDETPATAAQLASEHPAEIRVLRQVNAGPGSARERGRQTARGEFLQYLDSDDLLLPRKLELQVAALRAHAQCGIAYGRCREIGSDGSERRPALRPSDRKIERMFPTFVAERWWNTLTPLYRAELCARAGAWSELRLEEDWEYDARVAALEPRLTFVPEVVAEVRSLGTGSLSDGMTLDAVRLAWRAAAHESIAKSALRVSSNRGTPEMQHLSRELFQLGRFCAAAGLTSWTRRVLAYSIAVGGGRESATLDVRLFRAATRVVGAELAGRGALAWDRLRASWNRGRHAPEGTSD